ncbi:MAG: gephyrin-like molybdotransferase Glp [Cyanobacteria bacterium P01_A01_bin.135]
MLPAATADQIIADLVKPFSSAAQAETVPLQQAAGRILAEAIAGAQDIPQWDNSAMDGYAVRYADVQSASEATPQLLQVVETIPAGYRPQRAIATGEAARIFTGGMVPEGADTIVIQENVIQENTATPEASAEAAPTELNRVAVLAAEPSAFIRRQGAFYQAGQPLLAAGTLLGAPDIAVLATAQCSAVPVYRQPRVAILSTGNELVTPDQPLQPGQIVDSNQYALSALVAAAGAVPLPLGIVPDDPAQLKRTIAQALQQADVVLSTGGVSVGDYDYVDRILAELGAKIHVRAVAVKPGKPLTVATAGDQGSKLYFGLPGNPVSSLVGFWRFVQPALRKLSGRSGGWGPTFLPAIAQEELRAGGQRETYLWGRLTVTAEGYGFHLAAGSHSSGNLVNLSQTNALARVSQGETRVAAGQLVSVLKVGEI